MVNVRACVRAFFMIFEMFDTGYHSRYAGEVLAEQLVAAQLKVKTSWAYRTTVQRDHSRLPNMICA
jgi:hypothetical protein